ncbi:MAG TPA: ABC transporter ATP-binding protein [Herpetosiphonaceae bacterium]
MNVTGLRLEWRNVAKTYGARAVWRQLEGSLGPGEALVVRGANGAGKSTLLRLFCGLERPTAGTITYTLGSQSLDPRHMRPHIGLVAPDVALYRELTALEHLEFFGALRAGRKLPAGQALEQLAEVGLAGRERDPVATYSSGMALRLKYALALLHRPAVLLLDEPTAMFDEHGRRLAEAVVAAQRERGICVIATNDEREFGWGDLVLQLG